MIRACRAFFAVAVLCLEWEVASAKLACCTRNAGTLATRSLILAAGTVCAGRRGCRTEGRTITGSALTSRACLALVACRAVDAGGGLRCMDVPPRVAGLAIIPAVIILKVPCGAGDALNLLLAVLILAWSCSCVNLSVCRTRRAYLKGTACNSCSSNRRLGTFQSGSPCKWDFSPFPLSSRTSTRPRRTRYSQQLLGAKSTASFSRSAKRCCLKQEFRAFQQPQN